MMKARGFGACLVTGAASPPKLMTREKPEPARKAPAFFYRFFAILRGDRDEMQEVYLQRLTLPANLLRMYKG